MIIFYDLRNQSNVTAVVLTIDSPKIKIVDTRELQLHSQGFLTVKVLQPPSKPSNMRTLLAGSPLPLRALITSFPKIPPITAHTGDTSALAVEQRVVNSVSSPT